MGFLFRLFIDKPSNVTQIPENVTELVTAAVMAQWWTCTGNENISWSICITICFQGVGALQMKGILNYLPVIELWCYQWMHLSTVCFKPRVCWHVSTTLLNHCEASLCNTFEQLRPLLLCSSASARLDKPKSRSSSCVRKARMCVPHQSSDQNAPRHCCINPGLLRGCCAAESQVNDVHPTSWSAPLGDLLLMKAYLIFTAFKKSQHFTSRKSFTTSLDVLKYSFILLVIN